LIRCPYCGRNLKDEARFCSGCGRPLQSVTQSNPGGKLQLQLQPGKDQPLGTSQDGDKKERRESQSYWAPSKVRYFMVLITTVVVAALSLLTLLLSNDALRRVLTFSVAESLSAATELSDIRFLMFGALVLSGLTVALSLAGFNEGSKK
jgi:hypothetical protein